MAFCKTTVHVVQPGDTFYRLAQRYKTTVPDIIIRNPGVNPYNLQVGTRLVICTGQDYNSVQQDGVEVGNDMRRVWAEYLYWLRMYMVSLLNDLGDLREVEERLMRVPGNIARVFQPFYPAGTIAQMTQMLEEHVRITKDLIKAMWHNDTEAIEQLEQQWREDAERFSSFMSSINRAYNYEELKSGLDRHLDVAERQIQEFLDQEYHREISSFEENESRLMDFADYLTRGLLEQFYTS